MAWIEGGRYIDDEFEICESLADGKMGAARRDVVELGWLQLESENAVAPVLLLRL
jgi:hypothetical protein